MNDEPTVQRTSAENGSEREVAARPHSRRTLLTGAAAGLAGAAVGALASATPAGADNAPGHVTIANGNNGTGNNAGAAVTSITADPGATATFAAYNTSAGGSGIYGQAFASSSITNDYNAGIVGDTSTGDGVLGFSSGSYNFNGNGVHGVYGGVVSASVTEAGVYGESTTGSGVYGTSSVVGGAASGVTGTSSGGCGVSGFGASEYAGVYGSNSGPGAGVQGEVLSGSGPGVLGIAIDGGPAVKAESIGSALALQVQGKATFTRSGVVSLTTAGTSVLVTVPGGLTTTSHVLATLQSDTGAATLAIHAAVPNTSTGKVTIYFTGSAPVGTKVAWFVFG